MLKKIRSKFNIQNEGYSLVELIIVIAMMAILAGLALVTVSSISTAKATSAKETFNDELSTLLTYTKSQNGATNADGSTKEYAMLIKKTDNSKYVLQFGYSSDGTSFTQDTSIDEEILDRAVIYYKEDDSTEGMGTEIDETGIIIKYNKSDGSVISGYGVYTFCKRNSTNTVGKVTLNKASGSHYTGS